MLAAPYPGHQSAVRRHGWHSRHPQGTVTENRLTVERVAPLGAASPDEVLRLAALASGEATQDPIDLE